MTKASSSPAVDPEKFIRRTGWWQFQVFFSIGISLFVVILYEMGLLVRV